LEVAAVQILNAATCDLRSAIDFALRFLLPLVLPVVPSPSTVITLPNVLAVHKTRDRNGEFVGFDGFGDMHLESGR